MASRILPDQAYLRECFDYNQKTGALTWRKRPVDHFLHCSHKRPPQWICRMVNTKFHGKEAGATTEYLGNFYKRTRLDGCSYLVHRIIWKWMTGEDTIYIDHRDRNGLNNRFNNLRPATCGQNAANSKLRTGKICPKGVCITKTGYIGARIVSNGVHTWLGSFPTVKDAQAAYWEAAQRLHGDFANDGICPD